MHRTSIPLNCDYIENITTIYIFFPDFRDSGSLHYCFVDVELGKENLT